MASTKWNNFFKEFMKLEKIQPKVVKQKSIITDGLTLARTADMCPGEVIDIDYFYPSLRHYNRDPAIFWECWEYRLYKHVDNYEYVAAAMVQAAAYDIGHEYYNLIYDDGELICRIAASSREKFGRIIECSTNSHSRYFYDIDGYRSVRTYKTAAEYIHNLMSDLFGKYQFVEVELIKDKDERERVSKWTSACRKYRELSRDIKKTEGIEEIYPVDPSLFDGTIKVRCSKHGEYTIDVSSAACIHSDHLCPECVREEKEAEEREREAQWKLQQEKQRINDINNFIVMSRQKFGDFYDYSLVAEDYKDFKDTKVRIIHPEYGVFEMAPHHHIRSKTGHCNSHIKNIPTVHDITYVLGGNGEKISVGDDVKWQDDRGRNRQGEVTEIGNRSVTVKSTNGRTTKKDRHFVFAA